MNQTKQCPQCHNILDISAFSWDKKGEICNGCWNSLPSCSGCNDPDSEGTHQRQTREHWRGSPAQDFMDLVN